MSRVTILFDNFPNTDGYPTLWGFSALVQTPHATLLFDTGSNGRILMQNIAKLGINLKAIDGLFISHPHWDHIGGIDSVLEANPRLNLFLPHSLSPLYIRDLKRLSGGVTVVKESPTKLGPNFYSTGVTGEPGEHAAVFDLGEEILVITGCAHPGIESVVQKALEITGKPVGLLVGGFHLLRANDTTVRQTALRLQQLGIRRLCPTHCTGESADEIFAEIFGAGHEAGGVGREILL